MIEEIFPLSKVRINILTELLIQPLLTKEIAQKINKSLQTTYNTLTDMGKILDKNQRLYSIKPEIKLLFEKILIKNLLEKRLGKYYEILPYIKKFTNPLEMIFFGSFFRGDNDEKSDIDIYIISKQDSKIIEKIELKLKKALKRKIQIIEVKPQIHLTQKDKFSDLYNSISKNKKLGIKIPLDLI